MTSLIDAIRDLDNEPDGKHVMRVLAPDRGDFKITWDPDNEDEVAQARSTFRELRAKGMAAYAVDRKGNKGRVLTDFDPNEEAMILAPALQGG